LHDHPRHTDARLDESHDLLPPAGAFPRPPLTPLVGRDREVSEVFDLLRRFPVVTLAGVPGVGKSRLAVEVARRLDSPGGPGAVIVCLGWLTGGDEVMPTVAEALADAAKERSAPEGDDGDHGGLVVLDDCDRVLGACAAVAQSLVASGLRVLATARGPLGADGEAVWRVPPLSPPRPGHGEALDVLRRSEAVQLFCERAASIDPGFTLTPENAPAVAEICRRVDGIPLAIELAARNVRAYSPAAIVARLDAASHLLTDGVRTAHPRHHSLRASLAWSTDLLSPAEKAVFVRLAVFSGPFSAEEAFQVCAPEEVGEAEFAAILRRLVDKSLVEAEKVAGRARYRLLPTVAAFAAEELGACGPEDAVRTRHARWCVAVVEAAGDPRRGGRRRRRPRTIAPSAHPGPARPAPGLPGTLASLVGREREVAELAELLGRWRLVTLTGPPGVGKSRLALEVAAEVAHRRGRRVAFVDLVPLREPDRVLGALKDALGLGQAQDPPSLAAGVDSVGHDQGVLVVVDNCEHVIDACAEAVEALLRRWPALQVLATSREPLRVGGEVLCPVMPLSVPGPGADPLPGVFVDSDAVRLFYERAAAVQRGFIPTPDTAAMVAELCRRLDGLPLAIELAAALVPVLSPVEIGAHLDDRLSLLALGRRTVPGRHQSLEAALEWSYELLRAPEQVLLRRLSVFAGGFSLAAAEEVCAGGDVGRGEVVGLLTTLVGRSLVSATATAPTTRYRLLETIGRFAHAKLVEAGEAQQLSQRHARWCVQLVEAAGDARPRSEVLAKLDADRDNVRAALEWAVAEENSELALRLARAQVALCRARGHHREAREWLERGLGLSGSPAELRAQALAAAGVLAATAGDVAAARARLQESLSLSRASGDPAGAARSLGLLGFVSLGDDPHWALEALDESVALARSVGEDAGLADALAVVGRAQLLVGDAASSRRHFSEALATARRSGDPTAVANALVGLGAVSVVQGEHRAAEAWLLEGLAVARELPDNHTTAVALAWLGELDRLRGDDDQAQPRLREALELARSAEIPYLEAAALLGLGRLAQARGELAIAGSRFQEALLAARRTGVPYLVAPCLTGLAEVSLSSGAGPGQLLEEALAVARGAGDRLAEASALTVLAKASRAEGHTERAGVLYHQAVGLYSEAGDRVGIADCLEGWAGLASAEGEAARAARLLGAAQSVRDISGVARAVAYRGGYDADVAAARQALGDDAFEREWAKGVGLPLEEAIAYAARRRGPRPRSHEGWEALTSTEQQVAELVALGLTNKEVAERLFVSPRTVQSHLRHIFAKLGVATRAALARELLDRRRG
jgi:predicted ATPase/DNA-binding CsgD family transcriptional regulator